MDNMNNNINQNNSNIPNTPEGTPVGGINIGVIIGLIVLIGIIIGSIALFKEAYETFNTFTEKMEDLPQIIPDTGMEDGTDKDEVEQEYKEDDTVIDPYAKYKNIKWCGKEDTVKNIKLYIENGAVYSKDTDNKITHKWKTIGTPKRIKLDPPAVVAVMVTEEGKVYDISYDSCTQVMELSKYNIVDMAYLDNYTYEHFYFLTSDGNLIDRYGVPYEKYEFVGEIEIGKVWNIPLDKYNYGYHWNNEKDVYEVITNSSKSKLAFSKVYAFDEYLLVQTIHGKLFKYEYDSVAKQETNTFVSKIERKVSGDNTSLIVTFMDLSTKEYKNPIGGFDVKANKEINIDKLTKYVEQPKTEVTDLSEAAEELEKISDALQKQILNVYDGKTMTGAEALAAFQQYQNSDFSIVIVTNEKGAAYTGKYKLDEAKLKVGNTIESAVAKEHKIYEDGVYYMGSATKFNATIKRTPFEDLWNSFGINAGQVYYVSLIRDVNKDTCGIVFMQG